MSEIDKKWKTDKVELNIGDIVKQVANVAFTVRKIKNWLEEKMGADIDGDGRVGSGPYKKVGIFLLSVGLALSGMAANTNVAVWTGTESAPTACVHDDGGIVGVYFVGSIKSAAGNGLAWTNGTAATVVTPQAPSAVTPTITVTAQRPGAQTPTITVTKETGAVTASGANDRVTITNYYNPVNETVSLTDTNGITAIVVTNVTWSTTAYSFATNAVVSVTVTGGDAVMTNATAASSALLDYPTNATAASSALPLFATNATAVTTITPVTGSFVKP